MKKYLLLVEDEKLWEKFKESIKSDINTEIMELIKKKIEIAEKRILDLRKSGEIKSLSEEISY
jgi:hypothetical protein